MSILPSKTERIHSLDSLRAIMMMLGVVLHSAITYGTIDYGDSWILKDPISTHISNDFISAFIHSFRMQIFFLVAGFFGALLFYDRSPAEMIKNRISRILFPFMVFLILLWPSIKFAFTYTALIFNDTPGAFSQASDDFFSWTSSFPYQYLSSVVFVLFGVGYDVINRVCILVYQA